MILFMWTQAQNLIPYPDFNVPITNNCPPLYATFEKVDYWYEGGGSPDMYLKDCNYDYNGLFLGYSNAFYNPNGVIGIYVAFRTNYTLGGEVGAAVLKSPLIANELYYFSVDVQPRGVYHSPDNTPQICPTESPLSLLIYGNDGTITSIENEEDGAAISVNAEELITFNDKVLSETTADNSWTTLKGCFLSKKDYTDFAFGLSLGTFKPSYPCVDANIKDNWFNFTYFIFDNFQLYNIPSFIQDTFVLCNNQKSIEIDFLTYFDSIELEDLNPTWADGQGFTKKITSAGLHLFELNLNCGKVNFVIYVQSSKCDVNIFVPSAFSPNKDSNNDILSPFLYTNLKVENYTFLVFDRWGSLVHQSYFNDSTVGWNGSVNGQQAEKGTYVWSLSFDLIGDENRKTRRYQLSGEVMLLE